MKKIISGKIYNTKTANCIADWDNGVYGNNFNQCEESLYQTKKRQFFIAGSGGALSKYAESCGQNSWGGGEGIELLSAQEALEWCERHDIDADIIVKHFETQEG